MKTKLCLIIGLLGIVLISGCTSNKISISGSDTERTVSGQNLDIEISGIDNHIVVAKGSTVNSISISGIDNIVEIPEGQTPYIDHSGIDVQIIYY
ncbi:DUF3060 domain-containing protein [Methanococcus voltae]|uniref:Uncharacterized protein n=1 Tax=Methanococcus voltae (strain ATCC BAA-1334 / A3) TaxID=456320 RepID=D7DRC2_METV3|nr:DUF3060 domain-containing protein [Methanococcus voltae]MCS3901059.1 hypothetical protein [Methanococcus voltae]